ncbi:hypothetical protein CDAR_207031 [Caerostris darwini]|uniref:Uncharacterized protein n=1 Tax=Caerostris darwini TaxID=1538125 RepID=A0AAV4SL52_9ARAC|nr:hypothetical protein CDAR_207031 [Caerostris darwini]
MSDRKYQYSETTTLVENMFWNACINFFILNGRRHYPMIFFIRLHTQGSSLEVCCTTITRGERCNLQEDFQE